MQDERCCGVQDAGKQQAAAVLGVQACRCDLKPRAGRYLHRQSIAVQASPFQATQGVKCSHKSAHKNAV